MLVSRAAATVILGDVADVVDAPEPPIGGAEIQGGPGVILNVAEQYAADTIEVTKKLEAALEELRPGLAADGITIEPDLFRPADFITTATGNVRDSLVLGGVLVIVVLVSLSLRSARPPRFPAPPSRCRCSPRPWCSSASASR